MLDVKFIRQNPDIVIEGLKKKNDSFDLNEFLELDRVRRGLRAEIEQGYAQQNKINQELKQLLEKLSQGDEAMLALPGFGPKSLAEVKEKLQAVDLVVAEIEEEEEPEPVEEVSPLVEELAEEAPVEEAIVAEVEEAEAAPVLVEEVTEEEEVVMEPEAFEEVVVEPEVSVEEVISVPSEELPETIEAEPEDEEVLEFVEEDEEDLEFMEEDEDLIDKPKKKKKKDRRKRTLVYDEEIGEVVARRRRKPGRRVEDWEEY